MHDKQGKDSSVDTVLPDAPSYFQVCTFFPPQHNHYYIQYHYFHLQ